VLVEVGAERVADAAGIPADARPFAQARQHVGGTARYRHHQLALGHAFDREKKADVLPLARGLRERHWIVRAAGGLGSH
jgi:hypothetical protein